MSAPPAHFIQWWLGKTREERAAFMADPSTSDQVRANLEVLEVYCLSHSYEIYCEEEHPARRRFARNILRPETETQAPPSALAISNDCDAIGGRYSRAAGRKAQRERGEAHAAAVAGRLADFLETRGVLAASHEKRAELAQLMVRVLAEATLAAAYRQGTASAIEKEEASQHSQSQRRLTLKLQSSGHSAESTGTEPGSSMSKATGRPLQGLQAVVTVKPVFAYLRETEAMQGIAGLLAPLRAMAGSKRAREKQEAETSAKKRQNFSESNDGNWRRMREESMAILQLLQPSQPVTAAAMPAASGRADQVVTGVDMRFAINTAMTSLLPRLQHLFAPPS